MTSRYRSSTSADVPSERPDSSPRAAVRSSRPRRRPSSWPDRSPPRSRPAPPRRPRRSCTASPRATRCPTASCCGPGSPPPPTRTPAPGVGPPPRSVGGRDRTGSPTSSPRHPDHRPGPRPHRQGRRPRPRPATDYWYRFSAGDAVSPVGAHPHRAGGRRRRAALRFGVVSCANWEAGYFAAYRHLAAAATWTPSLHLGDYIYEYGTGEYGDGQATRRPPARRRPTRSSRSPTTASGTRSTRPTRTCRRLHARYAVHRDLGRPRVRRRRLGGRRREPHRGHRGRLGRPAGGRASRPTSSGCRSGSRPPGGDGTSSTGGSASATSPTCRCSTCAPTATQQVPVGGRRRSTTRTATITGRAQMDWLRPGCIGVGQQLAARRQPGDDRASQPSARSRDDLLKPLAELLGPAARGPPLNADQWDGYTADRRELLGHLRAQGVHNTVFLTGDIHSAWADDLPVDAATTRRRHSAATEFVVTR